MEIFRRTSLTEEQIAQIQEIQQYCMAYDGSGRDLFLSNDINYYKEMPCFFLSYLNDVLCGVLTVFAPTMETAEISAYVHPSYRRNGVFSEMLMDAWQVIHQYRIAKVLIMTDAVAVTCKEILSKWQGVLSRSEYLLVYQGGEKPAVFPYAERCVIRDAQETDLEKMIELNMVGFGEDLENVTHMVRENFNREQTRCFIGIFEDEIFGLGNVRKEGLDFYICGFIISPTYQGRGMGRFLLYQILKQLTPTQDESITLEVDSENRAAYFLYTTSGFDVQSQADYYRLDLPLHPR